MEPAETSSSEDAIQIESKPKSERDPRSYFKRMNTVASTAPFTEFSTERLDDNRRKQNIAALKVKSKEDNLVARQIQSVPAPVRTPLEYSTLFVDGRPDSNLLRDHLIREGRVTKETALALVNGAIDALRVETTLLDLEAPFTVCGDIHGQFYDLINLLESSGDPATTPYLFLGDYVDRGCFSCEVCFLLFSYKINYPRTFYMLRGNHESRAMTNIHNFKVECLKKYDQEVYDKIMESFDCLPLAAVLKCNSLGRFFCVHGGLSPSLAEVEDLNAMYRFEEVPSEGPMCDLLWSDPVIEDEQMSARDILDYREIDFVDNSERGIGYFFGFKAVTEFLLKNNLVSIVRAHEVQQEGCTEHRFTRDDVAIPMAFTVFSAPNYCDFYSNKSAYIKFFHNKYEIYQLEWVPHPYWLPDFQNVFDFSIDYVLEAVRSLLKSIASDKGAGEETSELGESNADWLKETQSEYLQKLATLHNKMKSKTLNASNPEFEGLSNEEKFKKASEIDVKKERASPTYTVRTTKKPAAADRLRTLKRYNSSKW